MADAKGLDQIPIRLTPEHARIIAAHAQLKWAIDKIKIPKFQIWEKNFDDTKYLLEKFLSVQFDTDEKKTYYMVKKK